MEIVSKVCPIGILIDIDLQTTYSSNVKHENKSNPELIENSKEKHFDEDTKPCSWLDQSPPKPPSRLIQKVFCTPKSDWKTPSPKSMKIINREASRIVDQLHSSPVNCSEAMLYDEIFPTVKSLDYDSFDEFNSKSKSVSAIDMDFTTERLEQCNPNSLDFKKCTISAFSTPISECDVSSNEKLSIVKLQSGIKLTEHHSTYEKKGEIMTPENETYQLYSNDKITSATCVEYLSLDAPKCVNVSSDNTLVSKHEVTVKPKMPAVSKGLVFKTPVKQAEKNKEKVFQYKGTRQDKEKSKMFKKEKSHGSIDDEDKEVKIRTSQISRNASKFDQSLKRNIIPHPSTLENQKSKVKQSLEKNGVSKPMIGKPGALQQKSNVVCPQTFSNKRDPLCKTMTVLEIPNATSSVRRSMSFQVGSTRNAIASSSRVLKPKMSLNQVSNIGSELSTPLKFGTGSQISKHVNSCSTNPMKRKSLAFQPNYSLAASNIKAAAQNDENSNPKKPVVTTSSRLRFIKKVDLSFQSKFKNDTLPRKLFS